MTRRKTSPAATKSCEIQLCSDNSGPAAWQQLHPHPNAAGVPGCSLRRSVTPQGQDPISAQGEWKRWAETQWLGARWAQVDPSPPAQRAEPGTPGSPPLGGLMPIEDGARAQATDTCDICTGVLGLSCGSPALSLQFFHFRHVEVPLASERTHEVDAVLLVDLYPGVGTQLPLLKDSR